jgi:putative FmdB family regulatory protein
MPIYEFVCGECGHEFEKILSFSAATPACANCGATNVERQMGRPAIHFKGSGWYITDSKKGGSSAEKSAAVPSTSGDSNGEKVKPENTNGVGSDNGTGGESKTADSSKEKPVSKETTSSPAKSESA